MDYVSLYKFDNHTWKFIKEKDHFELWSIKEDRIFASGSAKAVLAATLLLTEDRLFVEECQKFIDQDKSNENCLRR